MLLASVFSNKIHTMFNHNQEAFLFHLGIRSGDTLYAYEVHRSIEDAETDGRLVNKPVASQST
jgi:hypothetical protein